MSPGGHLATTALACGVAYGVTGSPLLTAGMAAGGFFIDVDHAVDYVVFDGRRDLRPGVFLRYYLEGRVRRAVLVLHSWELLAALGALAVWLAAPLLRGLAIGMAMHLALDVIFNGRFATSSMLPFYSFAWRWRRGFEVGRLGGRKPLARLREGFWIAFFRGPRLRTPGIAAVGRPTLPARAFRAPLTLARLAARSRASSHPRRERLEARPRSS